MRNKPRVGAGWNDMAIAVPRGTLPCLPVLALALLTGCASGGDSTTRPPSDSIRGILADLPPLDTAGLTDEQIAQAERARYLDAVLESKQRRDRRGRLQNGGRGPW
ncbi:MAG: hypothetical protein AAF916_11355 [Planctomycetota bacterium]